MMRNENMIEPQNPQCVQTSVSGSVFITTVIDGEKQYVRRLKYRQNGSPVISMTCSSITKALDFKTDERANKIIKSIGLGYKIERKND